MIVAAHQPNYLPNLGFFYKMSQADLFVIFTNLQFAKRDNWVRRHKIKGGEKDLWLTVPVTGSSRGQLIKDVRIDDGTEWRHKHQERIRHSYAKTDEKAALQAILEVYDEDRKRLVDVNVAMILCLKELLGITTPVVLDEEVCGVKQELLINTCKKYDADT